MSAYVLAMLLTVAASGADLSVLPPAPGGALEPAIEAAVTGYNGAQERQRQAPEIETVGPADQPQMLRATYRRAGGSHQVIGLDQSGAPVVTVRVRAVEFEKRVTNVNSDDLRKDFAKAPWRETPRGYLLDFQLRWNGSKWEQVGAPVAHPTLGVVGRQSAVKLLESGTLGTVSR